MQLKKRNFIKIYIALTFLILTSSDGFCQIIFGQDIINGGVTGAGFSTDNGSGSGSFDIYIEQGSTVKKAYLFFYSLAQPDNVNLLITLHTILLFMTLNLKLTIHKVFVILLHCIFVILQETLTLP